MPSKKVSPAPDPDTIDITPLGIELQRLRLEAGLSLDGLAERSGIPRNTIHRYENHRLNPTAKALLRLAIGLNINISELVSPLNHLRKR
ncbi:helix-turn-helix domain-containing protein [Mycobacteroides abscessus]|uniref:helix-turn-helix domain-containing protein n=1 Tax=Mycobacteroides abscessus TaxID=36809 RepID=UPI0009AB4677|nr:helix-turn-helix transcriptional regulator [Mycobacteroides abscessus]